MSTSINKFQEYFIDNLKTKYNIFELDKLKAGQ